MICHGLKSSAEHPTIKTITEKLHAHGHAVFSFNFSDAYGIDLKQQVDDIVTVAEHFDTYGEIVLLGGSYGALSVALAVNKSPRASKIKGIITLNGFFGAGSLGYRLLPKYMLFRVASLVSAKSRVVWKFYKDNYRPDQVTMPALVIHSRSDKEVLIAQSKDFFTRLAGPKEFKELKDADHNLYTGDEIDTVVTTIDEWLGSTNFSD